MTTSSIQHNSASSSNFQPTEQLTALLNRRAVVCRIIIKQTQTTATGFLIGENLLMTNHHVIKDREQARQAEAQFFHFDPESETITVSLDPDTFFHTSPLPDTKGLKPLNAQTLDFTIVAIKVHKKIQAFIHQAFLLSDHTAGENTPAYIIHHPLLRNGTCYQQISHQDNKIIEVTRFAIHYTTATLPGSSGAPVMDSQGQLVALHRSHCTLILSALIEELDTLLKTLYPHVCFKKEKHSLYGEGWKGITPQGTLFVFTGKEKGHYLLGNRPLLSLFHLFPEQHKRKAALEFLKTCGRDLEKHEHCNTAVSIKAILGSLTPQQRQVIEVAYKQAQDPFISLRDNYLLHSELPLLIGLQPLPIEKQYTTLAIITGKEKKESATQIKNASADQRISTYESIFKPKEGITLETVFENPQLKEASQKRILIQGSAGIGKSTLCQKIAYQWAKGDLWPEFKTLFWIKCRHLSEDRYPLDKKYALDELIENECDLPPGTLQKLTKEERKQALIILDGYDEFNNTQQWGTSQGKFSLLEAFQREFPHIILTTRPQSGIPFQKTAEMEILGFDNQGITSYIDRFFSDEKQKEKQHLLQQLKNPLVHSLCHIPINLEIFCSLGFEGKILSESTSPTLATLYMELTDWLIERFGKERLKGVSFKEAQDFNQIEAKAFIDHLLEEIGWKLMEKNTLFISLADLQNIMGSYPFQSDLAKTIKHSQIGPLRLDQQEGHFIHLTFQEFFAAKHLARLFKENQLKTSLPLIQQKKYDPRYQLVISMVSGILAKDPMLLQNFFDQLHQNPRDLGGTRELVLFARYFEQCGEAAKNIQQYGSFIQAVRETLENPEISDDIKLNLLSRNRYLLHQKEMINFFLEKTTSKKIELLTKTAEQGTFIPEQIVDQLSNYELYSSDVKIVKRTAQALGEIAKLETPLAEKILEGLIALLLDPKADKDEKECAAMALGKVAEGGTHLAEKALSELIALLLDPKANDNAKEYATKALGKVAEGGTHLAEKALSELIALLLDPKVDYQAKLNAVIAVGKVAKEGTHLAEKALGDLIALPLDPKADKDSKNCVLFALENMDLEGPRLNGKVVAKLIALFLNLNSNADDKAKEMAIDALSNRYLYSKKTPVLKMAIDALSNLYSKKTPLLKKALQRLMVLVLHPMANPYVKSSAADALEEVAKGGTPLSEKALNDLIALLLDPEVDEDTKHYVGEALEEIVKGGTLLPEKALEGLVALLLDPKANESTKRAAATALGEVAKVGSPLPEKALEGLTALLLDQNAGNYAKSSVASALGQVAKGGALIPEKALEGLSALLLEGLRVLLLDPKDNYEVIHSAASALEQVAKEVTPLTEKILEELSALLLEPNIDWFIKIRCWQALEELAQIRTPLAEKALERLIALLLDPKANYKVINSAASALKKVATGGTPLPEKAIERLIALIVDPKTDEKTKLSAVSALGGAAKGGTPLPEKAIERLIALLVDPKTDEKTKLSAVLALEGAAKKGGTFFSEKALRDLSALLLDPNASKYTKFYAVEALREVAKGGTPLPEKALNDLIALIVDPKAKAYGGKSSAAKTLREVAKGGTPLSEKALEGLSALLLDPKVNKKAKNYAAQSLLKIGKGGTSLSETILIELFLKNHIQLSQKQLILSLRLGSNYKIQLIEQSLDGCLKSFQILKKTDIQILSQICKHYERAFYTVNGKYYIANQREIYQVKEHVPSILYRRLK